VGLIEDIGRGPVALDTAPFIYFMEEHPSYLRVVQPLFEAIDVGRWQAVTSTVTLLETLVVPYRVGNGALADQYEALLTRGRNLRLVELDRPLLRTAALLRARSGMKTPDALQVAAALTTGCTAFITNDRRLLPPPGLAVLNLKDYVPPDPL
jgi:predicted nucleic acid-binding protein